MAVPYEHVNYDFGAADRLSHALEVSAKKVDLLIRQRQTSRRAQLGDHPGDRWSGQSRNRFDQEFTREQNALIELSGNLKKCLSAVRNATEEAHAVNAHAH